MITLTRYFYSPNYYFYNEVEDFDSVASFNNFKHLKQILFPTREGLNCGSGLNHKTTKFMTNNRSPMVWEWTHRKKLA